jgi:hypothetical protein
MAQLEAAAVFEKISLFHSCIRYKVIGGRIAVHSLSGALYSP